MFNKLLQRQIQKYIGSEGDSLPENLNLLLQAISNSYDHYEKDRAMLERSIELSSNEMIELNDRLRKKSDQNKKSHAELKLMFENIAEVFFSVDMVHNKILQISPTCEQVYGYSAEKFYENSNLWYEAIVEEDKVIILNYYPTMMAGQKFSHENRICHADGSIRWVETKITPTLDSEGRLIRVDGITSDITIRKKAEEKLHASESRFRSLIENSDDMISMMDETGKFIYVSPAVVKKFDFSYEECLSKNAMEVIHPADVEKAHAFMNEVFQKPSVPLDGPVIRNLKKDGTYVWVEGTITNLLNVDGVKAIVANFRDITERKQAEENIIEANNNLKISIESLSEAQQTARLGSWILDIKTNKTLCSTEFYNLFESSISEFPASLEEYLCYFHADDRHLIRTAFTQAQKDHQPYHYEARLVTKNGTIKNIVANGKCIENEQGELIRMHGTLQDVTKQKRAELATKESENKYQSLFEKMVDGVYKSSHEGKFIDVNPALVAMLGYDSKEELMAIDIKSKLYFDTADREDAVLQDKADGIAIFRLRKKNGGEIWVEDRGQYVSDERGNILYHEGILRDVTERVKANALLKARNTELTKTNSELDRFVYSVSHDLRAPLCSILGVIEIAEEDTSEELVLEHLNIVKGNIHKLDGFIEDILDYSRNSRMEIKKEKINFRELVDDITQNLKFIGGNNRKVDIQIEVNDTITGYCDKSRLSTIFNNLISNAIRYQNSQIPDPFVNIKIDISDTETGIIIKDNGIGIRKELHEKIFDMFYRVSDESVGSGLGLYIVKEAVAKLNGKIHLESQPGHGSTFKVKIPNTL